MFNKKSTKYTTDKSAKEVDAFFKSIDAKKGEVFRAGTEWKLTESEVSDGYFKFDFRQSKNGRTNNIRITTAGMYRDGRAVVQKKISILTKLHWIIAGILTIAVLVSTFVTGNWEMVIFLLFLKICLLVIHLVGLLDKSNGFSLVEQFMKEAGFTEYIDEEQNA